MKLSTAPSAVPVSSSLSIRMVAARMIQSGNQPGPGWRAQVVKLASRMTVRFSPKKSILCASPCESLTEKEYRGWVKKPSKDSSLSSSKDPSYTLPPRLMYTFPMALARSSGW